MRPSEKPHNWSILASTSTGDYAKDYFQISRKELGKRLAKDFPNFTRVVYWVDGATGNDCGTIFG